MITEREKLECYKMALKLISQEDCTFVCIALVHSLRRCTEVDLGWLPSDSSDYESIVLGFFPEFAKYKRPKSTKSGGWWPASEFGRQQRMSALNKIITGLS